MERIPRAEIEQLIEPYRAELDNLIETYVPNKTIQDITEDVFIVDNNDKIYKELKNNNGRAKCDANTGNIYIRNDIDLTAHLLIHEFIHRISRNKVKVGLFKKQWIEGIMFVDKKVALYGLNEVLTEWIAFDVTNYTENNSYQQEFKLIKDVKKHHNLLDKIIGAYFDNNKDKLLVLLYDVYGINTYAEINDLDNRIRTTIS